MEQKKDYIVKAPIRKIWETIDKNNEHVTVLKGTRGCGKSTVLQEKAMEDSSSIYVKPNLSGVGLEQELYGNDFINFYFEIEFSRVLLDYKEKIGILFGKKDMEMLNKINRLETMRLLALHDYEYYKSNLKNLILSRGEYSSEIIDGVKKDLQIQKLSLLIDRFDWNSLPAQKCFQNYFSYFDKVVLTTDDKNYVSSYKTVEVDYGKDKEILKEIVVKFLRVRNHEQTSYFIESLSDELFERLVELANGNISVILRSISDLCIGTCLYSPEEINLFVRENVMYHLEQKRSLEKKLKFYL